METGTQLTTVTVDTCHESLRVFGEYDKIHRQSNLLPIVCRPLKASFPWVSIPHGVFALKKVRGTFEKKPMEPGFHWMSPLEHVHYIITSQFTHFDIPVKEIPTKDNVMVKVDVILVFRIVEPYVFIDTIGPEKLSDMLASSMEETVRGLAQSTTHDKIYDLVMMDEDELIQDLRKRFEKYGVEITDMMITDVRLPDSIGRRLQNETILGEETRYQQRKQEYNIAKVNYAEEMERMRQKFHNERQAYEEEQVKLRKEIQKEIDEIYAHTEKRVKEIESEQKRIVSRIKEEAQQTADKLYAQRDAILKKYRAEAKAKVEKIMADAAVFVAERKAKTKVIVAENEAKKLKLLADAEEKCKKLLEEKRKFDLQYEANNVLDKFSQNESSIVHGSTGGNIVAQVIASQMQKDLY